MAKIVPIVASNNEELAQAIKLQRTAILVNNKDMYEFLITSEKESKKRKKISKTGKRTSALVGLGGLAAALFGPVGIFIGATYASVAGLLAYGGSVLVGIQKSDLENYQVAFDEENERLVLWKIKGKNAMKKDDVIDL